MPEYLRTAAASLPCLLRLLFLQNRSFCNFLADILCHSSYLEAFHSLAMDFSLSLLLANIMVPFFYQHRNPLNFVLNIFLFMNLHVGGIAEGNYPLFLE